jgi:hypothetical protein
VILPLGSLNVLPRVFQLLMPLIVETLALLLDIFDRTQAKLERGGFQCTKCFSRD